MSYSEQSSAIASHHKMDFLVPFMIQMCLVVPLFLLFLFLGLSLDLDLTSDSNTNSISWIIQLLCLPLAIQMAAYNVNVVINPDGNTSDYVPASFKAITISNVLGMLTTQLITGLGFIFFFIPGIIYTLNYALVPTLLVLNPNLTGSEARHYSKQFMYGHRGEYFGISFMCSLISMASIFIVTIPFINAYVVSKLTCYYLDRLVDEGYIDIESDSVSE